MPISYKKLFQLMESRGLKKYDLRKQGINPKVVDALWKDKNVNVSTITELCRILDVQPGDLMEYTPEDNL
ncbi:helix-turn-helix domain-containing protein [Agathobaculum sp.]|uniref:helix-turn-helix domain-containing protein n=1 Tax=Agathobaculum sp. TaxID=2048138 RepID=UPI002A83EC54|nr:helix-turn-helix transcriptional regulator [Agathobaculum sp.]MDY3618466.1 helix-turn-helix transcriptional regulator [Agathobaculum sp.]